MTYFYIVLAALGLWLLFWLLSTKKRLVQRMQTIFNAAKFVAFAALFDRSEDAAEEAERQSRAELAAAKVNYLFGESPSPQHAHLELPRVHEEAIVWLRASDIFRELVVQSLRVASN